MSTKHTISYVTYQHPTEGLLVRGTWHLGNEKPWVQSWRRCENDGKQITPEETLGHGVDMTSIELRNDGVVNEAPELRVGVTAEHGETHGELNEGGIRIEWGGACPVQGMGSVDGRTLYYRARGSGWSVDIAEGGPEEMSFDQNCYIWPDGGWVSPAESERNIRFAVEQWRAKMREPCRPAKLLVEAEFDASGALVVRLWSNGADGSPVTYCLHDLERVGSIVAAIGINGCAPASSHHEDLLLRKG